MFAFKKLGVLDFRINRIRTLRFCTVEDWRPIICEYFGWNFPNFVINSQGDVRNTSGKPIKGSIRKFKNVTIPNVDGKKQQLYVHRVVCALFHGDPADPKSQVSFLNNDFEDISASNLRWTSPSELAQSRFQKKPRALEKNPILGVREGKPSQEFINAREAAKETGIGYQTVLRLIKSGKSKEGWSFEWANMTVEDLPHESWKAWPTFPNICVSNLGRVKNKEQNRLISPQANLQIKIPGTTFQPSVARMVAESWVPKFENAPFQKVEHIDGDKMNNRADNLRWK